MPFQQGSARTRQRTVLLVGIVVLLVALVLAVVLASLLTHGKPEVSPKMMKWKDRGTTKNLQEVILGRCYNYVMARYPELG
ncbi:adp-ribosyl cyclase cyclic adp-ribose hydrolase 1 [Limosa lapponica baueri]|uniref:Adp-ribosyl cyclase cyclic adp-ribose hydrolase 1 n=2 Tax=Scolopacidae TaxID=8917 RepID=A0A2I0TF72_LIMLA|nr:adp-ribosyl cyclase cyclic adp-ribose hydrolase 1 [Limosa lapponica baueri]